MKHKIRKKIIALGDSNAIIIPQGTMEAYNLIQGKTYEFTFDKINEV